jgi:hypothetical protein
MFDKETLMRSEGDTGNKRILCLVETGLMIWIHPLECAVCHRKPNDFETLLLTLSGQLN